VLGPAVPRAGSSACTPADGRFALQYWTRARAHTPAAQFAPAPGFKGAIGHAADALPVNIGEARAVMQQLLAVLAHRPLTCARQSLPNTAVCVQIDGVAQHRGFAVPAECTSLGHRSAGLAAAGLTTVASSQSRGGLGIESAFGSPAGTNHPNTAPAPPPTAS